MGINRNLNNDVSNTYSAQKYVQEILPILSEHDLKLTNQIIEEVNSAGYYIQYLFELSWMEEEDFEIIDKVVMKYVLQFERWQTRNGLMRYLAKKGNYYVSDFLLEQFRKENDCVEGRDWNFTIRGVCSSALEVIKDKSKIDEYIAIVENESTRQDSFFIILLLGELKVEKSIPLLIRLLGEDDFVLQSAAIQALTKFKKKIDLNPIITPFLESDNDAVRGYAKKALK